VAIIQSISNPTGNNRQKYLGNRGLMVLIALLSAFVPLSTDLYLPALPGMTAYFNAPANLVNLTLMLFLVFYSLGMLLWGPLSDKYGRKPIILTGLAIYTVSSISCAVTANIYQLILFRVMQAVGGSSASAVAMAIVKDSYDGKKRESILAAVMSMVLISPIVAPVFGALLLKFTSWRGIFWALSFIGFLALAGTAAMNETIGRRNTGTIWQSWKRLEVVLKNPGFFSLLIVFSIPAIPFMAYLVSSSYIYVNKFGLSEQTYSLYYAFNSICLLLGPRLYIFFSRRFERSAIVTTNFLMLATSGFLICRLGGVRPWLFALTLLPATLAKGCIKPPGVNLMLEQQKEDTGSASSLINCTNFLMGSLGMLIISFDRGNLVLALGTVLITTGLACTILWLLIHKRPFIKQIPSPVSKNKTNPEERLSVFGNHSL